MRAEIRSSMATMASALALRVSARLKNMSWGDGDKGAIRSSDPAIGTELLA